MIIYMYIYIYVFTYNYIYVYKFMYYRIYVLNCSDMSDSLQPHGL